MAISRSLMNRQLRADGGIMQVAPREKFGLGSSIKKFVRKIIPNEVADIAVKAAPFVAPFNPAVAAAMSGLGTFDQTGSIGDSLKAGGMNYAGGQAARYLGGADFQGNPFSADGGAFRGGLEGLKGGFSSPLGNQSGFKLGKPVQEVQGVGIDTTVPKPKPTDLLSEQMSEVSLSPSGAVTDTVSSTVATPGSAMDSFNVIKSFNTSAGQKTDAALDLLKRGSKALFTKTNAKGETVPDKAAIIGAVTGAASYIEAKALAADVGVDLTEEEYDESLRDEKKEEYAGYLQNFFGGKKDGGRIGFKSGYSPGIVSAALEEYNSVYGTDSSGEEILVKDLYSGGFDEFLEIYTGDAYEKRANGGRIGFESGANEMIKTQLLEEIMPNIDTTTEDYVMIMTEDGPKMVLRSQLPSESMMMDTTTSVFGDAGRGRRLPEEFRANGGRIGFKDGTDDDAFEELDNIRELVHTLMKEEDISESEAYEKVIKKLYAKGGRVSRKFGSPKEGESEVGIMTIDVEAGGDEDEEDMMMAYSDAIFDRREKSALFRSLGDPRIQQTTKSFKNLDKILKNPGMFPEDEFMLKEYLKLKGFKDGGRIGFAFGSPDRKTDIEEELSVDTIYRPTDKPPMLEEMPGGDKMVGMGNTMKLFETPYGFDRDRFEFMYDEYLDSGRDIPLYDFAIEFLDMVKKDTPKSSITMAAKGGRIGLKGGSGSSNRVAQLILERDYLLSKDEDVSYIDLELESLGYKMRSEGGIMNAKMPTGQIRKNNAGVTERDYREEGGFVPVGIKERADDVPAMLSKNEFVMTADAVRGIGNGSVEEGSKKLYNTMKQAEKVGKA